MAIVTDGPLLEPETKGIDEFHVGLGARLGASAAQTWEDSPVHQLLGISELEHAGGNVPDFGEISSGFPTGPQISDAEKPATPRMDIIEANDRVRKAGLAPHLKLPDQPDIAPAQLAIMMDRARRRHELETTVERGPQGFIPGALDVGTSFLVGAVDPLNLASAFVPVMGELRYGKLLADAGSSALSRATVRAGVGAAQGAVGQALLEPLDWYSHTQDGRDFGMSDVLHNILFGAALGGGLQAAGGAVADIYRGRKGRPLYPYGPGEPLEGTPQRVQVGIDRVPEAAALGVAEARAGPLETGIPAVPEGMTRFYHGGEDPNSGGARWLTPDDDYAANFRAGDQANSVHYVDIPNDSPLLRKSFEDEGTDQTAPFVSFEAPEEIARELKPYRAIEPAPAPSPEVQTINDLPAQAHEDAMRGAISDLINGVPVRSGEMLDAASRADPRIAESFAAHSRNTEISASGARAAVFDDIHGKLLAAGMPADEAAANAAIVAARYAARAERLGGVENAVDLYRSENISIGAGEAAPEGRARRADPRDAILPGWDAADDSGAASPPGGAAARAGGTAGRAAARQGGDVGGQPRPDRAGAGAAQQAPLDRDAAWRTLARATPEFDSPEIVAASKAADAVPVPPTKLQERLAASEKADAFAKQMYDMFAHRLPEQDRVRLDDLIKRIDDDHEAREIAIVRGGSCLFGVV